MAATLLPARGEEEMVGRIGSISRGAFYRDFGVYTFLSRELRSFVEDVNHEIYIWRSNQTAVGRQTDGLWEFN